MERLTARDSFGNAYYPACFEEPCGGGGCRIEGCKWDDQVCRRLAEYEETGLTPEEIADFKKRWGRAVEIADLCKMGGIDHLLELKKAEQDGLLLALPCGTDVELHRDGHTYMADHWNHLLTAFREAPEASLGKQVALFSISEAEAALKGGAE